MEFYMKLPRNKKEFVLFMAVISIISVNIIAPIITSFEIGVFSMEVWKNSIKSIPFIWISVIILVLVTYRAAEWMTGKLVAKDDSFNAHIIINILCAVFLMSIFLTVIGTWIGSGKISMEPINMFFFKCPRNFAISFAVELIIAQPIARAVMVMLHTKDEVDEIKEGI